ncbi:MAG: MFS transporter [Gammaproteobacteria bacterium]|nr:MFS transporter [Gammaproteobacteria bacterium]
MSNSATATPVSGAPVFQPLPVSTYVGYGVGQIGGQILRDTPALILPIYMTTVLGLDAALGALVILIAKIWVVLADPLAGIISDRSQSSWGRRRPYILAGGLIAAASFVLLFFVPQLEGQWLIFAYLTAVYLLLNTGYSLFSVPYLTMASEMSDDPNERTTIMSFRNGFLAIGLIIGGAGAPKIVAWATEQMGGTTRDGYEWMAVIVGGVIAASTVWLVAGTAKAPRKSGTNATVPLVEQLRIAWENKPFVVLITANIVQYISAGIGYAGGFFFFAYALDLGFDVYNVIPIWIIVISVASIASMPVLVWAARTFGKMPVYKWCLVLFAVSIQGYFFADKDSLWIVWLVAAGIGLFNGGFILMSFSVLTDTINYDRVRAGISREGALSSVYSAVDKIGNALGSAIFLAFLSLVGFVESGDGSFAPQSDTVLQWLAVGYIVVPAVLHVGSIFILNRYNLDPNELTEQA